MAHERFCLFVETDEHAAPCAGPQRARTILIDHPHRIGEAVGILRNRHVVDEAVRRGIEAADTSLETHPHLAASISIDRVDIVGDQAAGIALVVPVALEASGALVETVQTAATAADPEIARRISVDAIDVGSSIERVVVPTAGKVMDNLASLPIQSVQGTREKADPHHAIAILVDRLYPARRDTVRIGGPVPVRDELSLPEIEDVEPRILGSHPQHAAV